MSNTFRTAVQTVVDAALQGTGYYASSPIVAQARQAVEEGVVEQVQRAADSLRATAEEQGLSASVVENALIEAGLVDAPEPEVEDEPATTEEQVAALTEAVGSLAKTVDALVNAARRNGITVAV
jgi:sirohydrochlorin ferrochelatase